MTSTQPPEFRCGLWMENEKRMYRSEDLPKEPLASEGMGGGHVKLDESGNN